MVEEVEVEVVVGIVVEEVEVEVADMLVKAVKELGNDQVRF